MEKQHWVQDLFPPRFSLEDLFVRNSAQVLQFSERFAAGRAKRIEYIYLQETKNFQQQKKAKRKKYTEGLIVHKVTPIEDQVVQNHLQLHKSASLCKTLPHRMEELNVPSAERPTDLCKNTEQCMIKAQLGLTHSQMLQLKANCKQLEQILEKRGTELCKAQQELQGRALTHIHNVQEIYAKDLQIQILREDLQNELMNVSKLRSEVQQARLEAQEFQMGKQRLLWSLEQQALQHQLEKAVLVQKVKLQSATELNKLQLELDVVKVELQAEKCQNARNKKDLELLCKHFACLISSNSNYQC
ncbi:coiled-coil domain-containing protein 160 [Mobula birostris]|uniref:coiled-coil domain-containing protein 160 n=1 Tax=Mobula birostris TaxID=1983395 RepID=UPI003B2899B6